MKITEKSKELENRLNELEMEINKMGKEAHELIMSSLKDILKKNRYTVEDDSLGTEIDFSVWGNATGKNRDFDTPKKLVSLRLCIIDTMDDEDYGEPVEDYEDCNDYVATFDLTDQCGNEELRSGDISYAEEIRILSVIRELSEEKDWEFQCGDFIEKN